MLMIGGLKAWEPAMRHRVLLEGCDDLLSVSRRRALLEHATGFRPTYESLFCEHETESSKAQLSFWCVLEELPTWWSISPMSLDVLNVILVESAIMNTVDLMSWELCTLIQIPQGNNNVAKQENTSSIPSE